MDIVTLIPIIILAAAINTLIIAIAVYLVFKIRIKKEEKERSDVKEGKIFMQPEAGKEIKEEGKETVKPQVKTQPQSKSLEVEKNKTIESVKPRFLKYTSKGYIIPEEDKEKEELRWQ